MNQPTHPLAPLSRRLLRTLSCLLTATSLLVAARAAEPAKRTFDLPANDAAVSLKEFTEQARQEILYLPDTVQGVRTKAVRGEFEPREALERMLAGTPLIATQTKGGVLAVNRSSDPNAARVEPSRSGDHPQTRESNATNGEEALVLSAFSVTSQRDYGYRATNTITATRTGAALIETPLNVSILTEELLQDIGATSINDGLRYVSNVAVTPLGADGRTGQSGSKIRGFNVDFQVRNGFRRNRNISVRNIDRVEVVKGPASLLFGQTPPGGLINYITKRPQFAESQALELTYGSYEYMFAGLDLNGVLKRTGTIQAAYRLYSSRLDTEGWRDFEFARETYVTPQLAVRVGRTLQVFAEFEYADREANTATTRFYGNKQYLADYNQAVAQSRTQDARTWFGNRFQWRADIAARTGVMPDFRNAFDDEFAPGGKRYNYSGPDQRNNASSKSWTLEATWQPASWLDVRYGGNVYDVHFYELSTFADEISPDGSLNYNGRLNSRNNDNVITSHQVDAVFKANFFRVEHALVLGGEFVNDYETNRRLALDINAPGQRSNPGRAVPPQFQQDFGPVQNFWRYYQPFVNAPIRLTEVVVSQDNISQKQKIESDREGWYGSYRAKLFDNRLNLMVGTRHETFDSERLQVVNGRVTLDHQAGTTHMAGANFRVARGLTAFASFNESFLPNADVSVTGPAVLPGEAKGLGSQEGKGYDIGLKTDWRDNTLSGTLSFFNVELGNLAAEDVPANRADPRNRDPNDPNNILNPPPARHFSGSGQLRSQGMELDLVWSPRRNLQTVFSYAWMWKAVIENGVFRDFPLGRRNPNDVAGTVQLPSQPIAGIRLERAPEHSGSMWSKYTFTEGELKGLSLGAGAVYVDRLRVQGENSRNAVDTRNFIAPSYVTFDFMAGYDLRLLGRNTRVALNVRNLFDRDYVGGYITPGEPRKIFLSARVRF